MVDQSFPVLNPKVGEEMKTLIAQLQNEGDSAGGLVECAIVGMPMGIGGHLFGGIESHLSQILYAIPAVKELRFGNDAVSIDMLGSEYNDDYTIQNHSVILNSNHAGGILGGISNGMPILFQVGFKPTPSIALPQKSVNLMTMEEVTLQVKGRHDPCIVPRAVPVVEAAAAIAIYDLILGEA
jgi:chorismate synthase